MSLNGQKILVIGGSSGIGLSIAKHCVEAGAQTIIAGRSEAKLKEASTTLGNKVQAETVDLTELASVTRLFEGVGEMDHLIITASSVKVGAVKDLPLEDAIASMNSKFWGPYRALKVAQVRQSVTLFSGILAQRPQPGLAVLGAINAAVEGLCRGLALELAPVRVNVLSPGMVDTPVYDGMPPEQKAQHFQSVAKGLPVGKMGQPDDIAQAVLMLIQNPYMTGSVVTVDGGALLV